MIGKILILTLGLLVCAAPLAYAQTAECSDGSTSYSPNFHGTCSHHGGVAVCIDEAMEDEANQWCDENPDLCAQIRIGEVLEVTENHSDDEVVAPTA
jgi:hypothetical protein